MKAAIEAIPIQPEDQVFLMGCDTPHLPEEILQQAFSCRSDLILGPSADGGYYLLGMKGAFWLEHGAVQYLFEDLSWGSRVVLQKTLQICRDHQVTPKLLPFWYDLDHYDDLALLRAHRSFIPLDHELEIDRFMKKVMP